MTAPLVVVVVLLLVSFLLAVLAGKALKDPTRKDS